MRQVMQPASQQPGDQGCPNLNAQRVLARADERLDFQVLLERLEEQFDLPTILVNGGDGCRAKLQVVCQQFNRVVLFGNCHDDPAQFVRAFFTRLRAGQLDDFVRNDAAVFRRRAS